MSPSNGQNDGTGGPTPIPASGGNGTEPAACFDCTMELCFSEMQDPAALVIENSQERSVVLNTP